MNIRIFILTLFLMCAGCGTSGGSGPGFVEQRKAVKLTNRQEQAIAVDFVSLLMQLPDTAPFYTTIQASKPKNGLGDEIVRSLEASGYGVQRVSEDQGTNYINYRMGYRNSSAEDHAIEVSMTINKLEITRPYLVTRTNIFPAEEFSVSGTKPRRILINSDIFNSSVRSYQMPSAVKFINEAGTVLAYYTSQNKSRIVNKRADHRLNLERALITSRAAIYSQDRINSDGDQQKSLRPYKTLKIRFRGNDLSLGKANKNAISKLIREIDQDNDRIFVVGCSHGKSLIWDGSESASLNRQQRISNEILAYGIRADSVEEAGCFQNDYLDELEPGMVIISHKKPFQRII